MYWYKVKTLLIWLFAAINVFLIIFIVQGNIRQKLYEKNELYSLTDVLRVNNISVDDSVFMKKFKPLKTTSVENLIPDGKEMAKILLGENLTLHQNESGMTVYAAGNKKVYVDNGKIFYKNDDLISDKNLGEEKIELALKKLENYNIQTDSVIGKISGDKIVFTYYHEKTPLFENTLYVKMSGEEICEIGGYLIGFGEKENESEISSLSDVLIDFLRDEKRESEPTQITSVELGYSILLANTSVNFKTSELIPTFKIKTDKNKVYYYDARP